MYAVQRVLTRSPKLLKVTESQCRTILGTPPRVRVSFAEKMAMGAALWLGLMTIPLYISCNIKNYNAHSESE
ncbi:uncharacterized protein LOC108626873 [Ceratina calcarata]|uniref:Uncharacterized protein LOC108626873 n=1 Tax=Ceratina calcarata TaxID=156304 RepID=A0AAJ7N8Q1_9HYME|nr:uncharacterized protein LOC108626873 [Ceratina calcarata]